MSIKYKDVRWKKVICEDLTVGEVKEVIIDPSQWKVTHLEVELTNDAAELALGIRKGGIRNLLAVSAIGSTGKTIKLKVKKGQLQIYLKAPKPKS
jgi:sporulation protein YlmC with PRC-barrel domain